MTTESIELHLRQVNGDKITVKVPSVEITVQELKALVEKESTIPAAQQRLIFAGHVMKVF